MRLDTREYVDALENAAGVPHHSVVMAHGSLGTASCAATGAAVPVEPHLCPACPGLVGGWPRRSCGPPWHGSGLPASPRAAVMTTG